MSPDVLKDDEHGLQEFDLSSRSLLCRVPLGGQRGTDVLEPGAVLAGATFVLHEARVREPMLDLRLFRNPRLAWGTVAMTLAGLAIGGLAFMLTQYLQFVQGYTPLQAGLRFLPIAVGFGIASPITQRLVPRIGTTPTVAAALGGGALLFAARPTPRSSTASAWRCWPGLSSWRRARSRCCAGSRPMTPRPNPQRC